jgi:predicted permease
MGALREWVSRLGGTLRPGRSDSDLEQELRVHLEMAAEKTDAPISRKSDLRAARIRTGGIAHAMETLRDQRGLPWLEGLVHDARHGFRLLRRNPAFAAVAILSLALGIGANSAVFSIADAELLRPLPVRDPGAIVTVSAAGPDNRASGMSYPNYADLRKASRAFEGLVAYQRSTLMTFAQSSHEVREMRMGMLVSDNFFDVLGVRASSGRLLAPEEGRVPGRNAVVVLGYDFWKKALAEDPSIVNRTVWINGIDFTVVGVASASFTGMDESIPAFFVPITMAERLGFRENLLDDRGARSFAVKGRLKSGVSRQEAQTELTALWQRLEQQYPDWNRSRTISVHSQLQQRIQEEGPATAIMIAMMMALVAVVLLIACANIASLMLGRGRARSREMAIRLALGVSRIRLLRQLLIENLLLALIGYVLGLGFAFAGLRLLQAAFTPTELRVVIAPQLDQRVLIVSVLAAVMSALLSGLPPAWQSLKTQLVPALKAAEPGETTRQRAIGRNVLVVGQVALSMILLVVTGMLLDGFRKLLVLNPGFRTDRVVMMALDTSIARSTPVETKNFYRALADRARALPGVASVALTSWVPLDRGGEVNSVLPEGSEVQRGHEAETVFSATVDEHYFGAMNIDIIRGRTFTANDKEGAPLVAIINEEFARAHWPSQDPIGKRLRLNDISGAWLEVVGTTKTGKYLFVAEPPTQFLYRPFAQHHRTEMTLLVETSGGDPALLASPLRGLVRDLDVNQPVVNVRTLASLYERRAIDIPFRILQTVGTIGLIGLTLALVGLYGLVAYSVARRTREIGLRMAIGADRSDVLKMVLRQGFILSTVGILVGGIASIAVARLLAAGMVGIGTPNPATYTIVPLLLMGFTTAASYIPARRASLVDPLTALRDE